MELPALQLFRASSARSAATSMRMSACSTCRPSPNTRSRARAPRRGSTASSPTRSRRRVGRIAPLPHAVEERRRALASSRSSREAPQRFYLVGAGAYERHDWDYLCEGSLPADGSVVFQNGDDAVRRPGARRAALARAPAEADRRRPVERQLSRGSPGRFINVGARPGAGACASTSSASSAGSCITRSRCRTPSSIFSWRPAGEFGSGPSASAPWTRCGSKSPTA